jgi:hypothetical protein
MPSQANGTVVGEPTENEWNNMIKNGGAIGLGLEVVQILDESYGKVANEEI